MYGQKVYHLEYTEKVSLLLDIKILWTTFVKVFKREGVGVESSGTNDFNDYRDKEWIAQGRYDLVEKARNEAVLLGKNSNNK